MAAWNNEFLNIKTCDQEMHSDVGADSITIKKKLIFICRQNGNTLTNIILLHKLWEMSNRKIVKD